MKKTIAILAILTTVGVQAESSTRYHGEGLPSRIEKNQIAVNYLSTFLHSHGVSTSGTDGDEMVSYDRGKFGVGMKKASNREGIFRVLAKKNKHYYEWNTGADILNKLKAHTAKFGCVPKLTIAGHGWGSSRPGEVKGIPGATSSHGLFSSKSAEPRGKSWRKTKNLDKDLRKLIKRGKIKFCGSCLIQTYSCNVGVEFGKKMAEVTGCQSVISTGRTSPRFLNARNGKRDHHWMSQPGSHRENRDGGAAFYRATPVKNSYGKVTDIIEENLGKYYMSY